MVGTSDLTTTDDGFVSLAWDLSIWESLGTHKLKMQALRAIMTEIEEESWLGWSRPTSEEPDKIQKAREMFYRSVLWVAPSLVVRGVAITEVFF